MLECLTSIFRTLHVLIDGENNSTEGGMPFPKLGLEVQSLSPFPRGRSHSVCQLVLLLWSRELRNRELKKVWALELAFSSLLSAGEYCYYKQQIIKKDNQCILLTGSHILRGLGHLFGAIYSHQENSLSKVPSRVLLCAVMFQEVMKCVSKYVYLKVLWLAGPSRETVYYVLPYAEHSCKMIINQSFSLW